MILCGIWTERDGLCGVNWYVVHGRLNWMHCGMVFFIPVKHEKLIIH